MKRIQHMYRRLHLKLRKWGYSMAAQPILNRLIRLSIAARRRRVVRYGSGVFLILLVGLLVFRSIDPVRALSKTIDSMDLVDGTTQYGEIKLTNNQTTLALQDGAVGTWDTGTSTGIQSLPTRQYGTSVMKVGPNGNIYYMSNQSNTCYFYKYDLEIRQYVALDSAPIGCGAGTTLSYNGSDAFYYTPGGDTSAFFRYDIGSDSWTRLADMPAQVGSLGSADFVNRGGVKSVFIFRGAGSASFWRYDIASNSWTNMAPYPTSSNVSNGIAMVWDGGDTIYGLGNHTGEFKKYSLAANSWTSLPAYTTYNDLRSTLVFANGKIYAVGTRVWNEQTLVNVYDIVSASWTTISTVAPPHTFDWALPAAYDGSRYIYTQMGSEYRPEMYRYDVVNGTWNARDLFLKSGSEDWHFPLAYDGGQAVYYAAGYDTGNFRSIYRHNLATGVTEQVGSQFNSSAGWRGAYSGGSVYFLSNQNTDFLRFDVSTGTLTTLAPAPYTANWGSDIIDGGDGYLYTTFGGRTNFYRYNIAGNAWEARTSIISRNIYPGGGITRIGRTIYVLHGDSSGFFSKYNMDTNTWSSAGILPTGKVDYGGFITSDGSRFLYLGLGDRTSDHNRRVWRFDTTNGQWLRIADLPASANIAANAFYDTTNNKLYVSRGWNNSDLWSWSPSGATYVQKGVWYSKKFDFTQVQSWGALESTIGGVGTATIYTRSSSNGRIWSDWQATSGATINSPANRYVQLKVEMTGNGTVSPTVSGLKINYNQETVAPTLPSQFSAKSKAGGIDLVSGQTAEWQHPYFSWDGSSDGVNGSGVKGYYVYFGTNSNADPVTDGNFQKEKQYTVTAPMTAGEVYYVRIKVADNLGNISGTATFFSYRYFYISPPGSIVKTSDADFNAGVNSNLSISNGSLQLKHKDNGAWSYGSSQSLPDKVRSSASAVVGDYVYTLRGNGTTTFWRYNTVAQVWETLAPTPATVNDGSSMTWDGGNYLYAVRGNNTNDFYRYDIQNNIWETLPALPASAQQGTDISYIGNNTIALFFTGVREFYKYTITTRAFTVADSYPSAVSYGGSGIWYDGRDTIYAYLGGQVFWNSYDNNRSVLVKYTISTDSWRELAQPPIAAVWTQNNLVGDGRGNLYIFSSDTNNNNDHNQQMIKYNIASNMWSEVEGLNNQVYYGSVTSDNKRYLYIMPSRVGISSRMIKYDTWNNIFTPNTPIIDKFERMSWDWPGNAWAWSSNNATTAVYDGSKYLYAIGASEQSFSFFVKYDVSTGETTYLPAPFYIGIGGSLAFINGELYYLRAASSTQFYKFDQTNQSWVQMADSPVTVYRPGSGSLIGAGNIAYAFPGNNTRNFYTYAPGVGGGTWTRKADIPAGVLNGSAVYDSANGYIYLSRANGTNSFYRYTIATDSWTTLASTPVTSGSGSSMVLANGKIYWIKGDGARDAYVYDVAGNTWTRGEDLPDTANMGSTFTKIDDTKALMMPANGSSDIWQFNFPTVDKAYQGFAQHISEPFVVSGLFDYAGISAEATIPANTAIEFWTRSSDDGTTWDDWTIADQQKYYNGTMSAHVTSTPRKYTQVKAMLYSYDNVSTPTLGSYNLQYYFDVDPPTNPTTISVYSDSTKQTAITSNTWYNQAHPTFDWPDPGQPGGPTDGPLGSNVKGYWVYFGNDETAVPRTAGVFVTDTQYVADLTKSGNYFFRLQAQDMTGNVDPAIYSPFTYKFDNTPPSTPSMITVTPGGYTTRNNYTFDWPASFDGDSGIAGYCYHTGAMSGPFANEICQTGRNLTDLSAAYRTGTNVFYLRTIDNAGNYSSSYTTVSYYYSTDPPSPPTNLRAIPPTSTQNLFAYAWDLPALYSGDPNQLVYCYSINELPAPHNTTCTTDRFISAFKAATKQGTNVLYMVTKDEAGNVNWTNYASANFIANTVSPGLPLNLGVNDTSDQATNRWSLTLTWSPPTFEGNGIAYYVIERSPDGHTFTQLGNTSTTAFVDLQVQSNTTYYYRVRASDSVGNAGGASGTVSGIPKGNYGTPPQIVVEPSVSPEADQAHVKWVTSREATSFVYYGTSPTDLSQSKGSLMTTSEHDQTITGLQPSTTYYYRVQSFDNERSYDLKDAYSQLFSFRTVEAAQVYNVTTDSTTLSSTIINWQTSVPTKTRIEYGPDTSYSGAAIDDQDAYGTNHVFRLTGLGSGTTYHFRIVSKTAFGSTLYSDDYTVTTLARPVVANVRFQPLTEAATAGVRVTWTTNVPTTSTLRYRGSGVGKEASSGELTTTHTMDITDLASATNYTFNAEGRDSYGNLTTSEDQVWQSGFDTRAPSITKLNVSMTTMQGSSKTRAQLIISWTTDEPATSQVSYDTGSSKSTTLSKQTPLSTEPTTNHVVVISNLDLATIYKLQVTSRDLNGNTAFGKTTSVVTPDKETSILDGVLTILERVFKF